MSDLVAREVYDFIDKFDTQQEFAEFVRVKLDIKNREINDIQADYTGSREQKYQTICLWRRKKGRNATIDALHQHKREFRDENDDISNSESDVESTGDGPTSSTVRPQTSNVQAIFHTITVSQPQNACTNLSSPGISVDAARRRELVKKNVSARARNMVGVLTQQVGALNVATEETNASFCDEVLDLKVKLCRTEDIQGVLQQQKDVYPITNNPKGYVLIINNTFAGCNGERAGAELDAENMNKLWTQVGCTVRVEQDIGAGKIYEVLEKLSKSKKIGNFDFLVIFIMSHGGRSRGYDDIVVGADGDLVYVADMVSKFDNESCEALRGKPKLFFFQCCRGNLIDSGVPCNASAQDEKQCDNSFTDFMQRDSLPQNSDMLMSYATLPGYSSYRNAKGSWFVNAVANVFAEFARSDHVVDLMTRVRRAVMAKEGYAKRDFGPGVIPCKEMSESCDRLARKLFLLPGYLPHSDPLAE